MAHRFHDVAAARLTLAANHRRAFGNAAQRLAQVLGTAHEGNQELVLGDVILFVGGREHFGLVDVIDAERLEALRFREVADARLGHHRNRDRIHHALHEREIAHPGDAPRSADICRNALERHHGNRSGFLRDGGLFRRHDVHDDAAFEHLREAALDRHRAGLAGISRVPVLPVRHSLFP